MNSPRPCPNVSAAKTVTTAGLDRASKTTCADELLPNGTNCPNFVNADLIAARSNPLNPERAAIAAGRIMISMIDDHVIRGGRFAFETTLNGPAYDRGLAGKPLAGFCTTPSKQITVKGGGKTYHWTSTAQWYVLPPPLTERFSATRYDIPELRPHRFQSMLAERPPLFDSEFVGITDRQLSRAQASHPRPDPGRQLYDHIDVAVPAEIGGVLVRSLEEDLVSRLLRPPVVVQRPADGYVGLRRRRC